MRNAIITFRISRLLSLALLLAAAAAPSFAQEAPGRQKHKLGDDLRAKAKTAGTYDEVDVIVRPVGSWTYKLDEDLNGRGATKKQGYANYAFRAVRMKAKDLESFASRPDVAYVSLDREVKLLGHVSLTSGADAARALGGANGYTGAGIGIAIVDSGVFEQHQNFRDSRGNRRAVVSVDFTGERRAGDAYGHGSHVASLAAGGDSVGSGAYRGVAPDARIIDVRVLDSEGRGTVSRLLAAIDWIKSNRAAHNIRVVNMSLGAPAVDSYTVDPLCLAVRDLVNSGIVVVAAAGNEGKRTNSRTGAEEKVYGLIHAPGNDPSVITVGATNTYGTDERSDDRVATYSSRGPTRSFRTDPSGRRHYDNLIKPDLVAPGNRLIAAQSFGNKLVAENPSLDANVSPQHAKEQMYLSGTSMAAPVVAGAAALMLQANPRLTPNMVKALLMYTAQQLAGFNTFEQGAGQLNVEGAVRLARLVRTDLTSATPVGAPLLNSPTAPAPRTTISGQTFLWSQGLVMDHTFVTGADLILKYQKVYGLGVVIADGVVVADGVIVSDRALMTDGVVVADHILTSNGVVIADGSPFLSCGALVPDGVIVSDGVVIADGIVLADGVVVSDGVVIADGVVVADLYAAAKSALFYGDVTSSMQPEADAAPASHK